MVRHVFLAAAILVLNSTTALPDDASLNKGTVPAASTVTTDTSGVEELPTAFRNLVPESLEQLREIEQFTTRLVPQLKECTVNIRVGPSQGSGVIVSSDGLILTAAHVVTRPGRRVSIVFQNGDTYRGKVLGRNTTLDAAMVQLESDRTDWPHCELGTMDSFDQGDWCIVLGHPGGFMEDRGLVTRLGRVVHKTKWYVQSDCELVGGDSGGPIFDMRGKLIGISTRIGEDTSANFHVPISAYHDGWDRMLASEDYHSHSGAYLGLSGDPVEGGVGLKLTDVYPGTPADVAGLRVGDVVVTVESKRVTDTKQLAELVGEFVPGETVKMEIVRNGKPQTIEVRLGLRFD
ncbi:MAG: trypsin-like peptidase domain-containing protein [Planctomycetaceae bacterium]